MRPGWVLAGSVTVAILLGLIATILSLASIAGSDSCGGCTRYATLTTILWIGSTISSCVAMACAFVIARAWARRRRR